MKKGAVILCGGKSSRMGRDKATLPFGSELMLQRIVRILGQVVDPASMVIVAAAEQELPEFPSIVQVARDERPDRGPLEGLAAGLRSLPSNIDAIYATSCDAPLLSPDFVTMMFDQLGDHSIAVPFDGKFHHPLAAVYRPRVLSAVLSLLDSNRLGLRWLFKEVSTKEVPVEQLRMVDPKLETLLNLNDPNDYEAALAIATEPQK
jgi:molybdopterin-guanine dinucleotide biosynthesis protein A